MAKIEVKPFNKLPFEKRVEISYYSNLCVVQELMTLLELCKDDITPSLRRKISKMIKDKKDGLNREYVEVE